MNTIPPAINISEMVIFHSRLLMYNRKHFHLVLRMMRMCKYTPGFCIRFLENVLMKAVNCNRPSQQL